MAKEVSTTDQAATCGACGQTRARHLWGPEQAMLSSGGCDGWKEEASASSFDPVEEWLAVFPDGRTDSTAPEVQAFLIGKVEANEEEDYATLSSRVFASEIQQMISDLKV